MSVQTHRARFAARAAVILAAAIFPVVARADAFSFPDFSSAPSLSLNGTAVLNTNPVDGSVLRPASNDTGQAGSAFTNSTYSLSSGFSTFFTFRMSGFDNNGFYGADGLLFVLQADPRGASALGSGGGTLAYDDPDPGSPTAITNSAAIEFDTFGNGEHNDPDSNHVALDLNGSTTHSTNLADPTSPTDLTPLNIDLHNEHLFFAWIDYDGTTIQLRLSQDGTRSDTPLLSQPLTLDPALNYHVGFTASTGSGTQNSDVLNWSFNNTPSPYSSVSPFLLDHVYGDFLAANPSPAEWSNPTSWQQLTVPTNATTAYMDPASAPYTLNVTTAAVVQQLDITGSDDSPVTLSIHDGGTLSIASDLNVNHFNTGSAAHISIDGVGSQLNVVGLTYLASTTSLPTTVSITNGGTLNDFDIHVSTDPNGSASVSVDGSDSTWTTRFGLNIGESGATGSISLTNQSYTWDKEANVGNGGPGSASVDNSLWHTDDTLTVANGSPGSITASNASVVEAYNVRIGSYAGFDTDAATVTLDASNLNVAADVVVGGPYSNSTLTLLNTASASSSNLFIAGNLDPTDPNTDPNALLDDATSVGTVLLDNSNLDNNSGTTHVGYNGTGTLTLQAGSTAVSDSAVIGENTSATGTATLTGANTLWNIANNLTVGLLGNGSLTLSDSANLNTDSLAVASQPGSVGLVTVDGADSTLAVASLLSIGSTSGSIGAVNIGPGTLSSTNIIVHPGSSLNVSNLGNLLADNLALDGSLNVSSGFANITYIAGSGSITLADGAQLNASAIRVPTVSVTHSYLYLNPSGTDSAVSVISSLTLSDSSSVDLTNNPLILTYDSPANTPISTIRGYLQSAYHNGGWDSPGLYSSNSQSDPNAITLLAYAEASTLLALTGTQTATWHGQTVDSTTLLILYTYAGDANMDGVVDADDYAILDRSFQKHLTPGSAFWTNGDFNYDGQITSADYLLIDKSYALQTGALDPSLLASRESQFGEAYVQSLIASVPEPTSLLAACGFALPLLTRRRRQLA